MANKTPILIGVLVLLVVVFVYVLRSKSTDSTTENGSMAKPHIVDIFPYGKEKLDFKQISERELPSARFYYPKFQEPEVGLDYRSMFNAK